MLRKSSLAHGLSQVSGSNELTGSYLRASSLAGSFTRSVPTRISSVLDFLTRCLVLIRTIPNWITPASMKRV
jgi:hypothetical protein